MKEALNRCAVDWGSMSGPDTTRLERMRVMDVLGGEIGRVVEELYTSVAREPEKGFHFPTGASAARLVGYPEPWLRTVPDGVVERFAGVGCPLRFATPRQGEAVLDLGSGSGTDVFVAAGHVGPTGRVVGVDLTESMVELARGALKKAGVEHASIVRTRAPKLKVEGPFDLVTSNGVLNLIPDKEAVLDRLHGLLAPDGRLVLSDIALTHAPSIACLSDAELWAECLVGAFTREEYIEAVKEAGFEDVTVQEEWDYFQHSDSKKTRETAEDLGAFAWVITARRAGE